MMTQRLTKTTSLGMDIRMKRILSRSDGRTFILPLDHGLIFGPEGGLEDIPHLVNRALGVGVDALLVRPGLLRSLEHHDLGGVGIIAALTGRLTQGVDHVVINSVEEAIRCGADAIALELKLGSEGERDSLRSIAPLSEIAHQFGLPVLLMVYPVPELLNKVGPRAHIHACRVGEELGADIVKSSLPDDDEILADCISSITIPLVVAGGGTGDFETLCARVATALRLGAAGAAVGRHAWGHPDPDLAIERLMRLVHEHE
jgi:DhnA family fructose-bisphosphate aldolase class Ia